MAKKVIDQMLAEGWPLSPDFIAENAGATLEPRSGWLDSAIAESNARQTDRARQIEAERAGQPKRGRGPGPEALAQMRVIAWADDPATRALYPDLEWLIHVPNSGKRSRAAGGMTKAMGMRKGVVDLILFAPRGGFGGLAGDLKMGRNDLEDSQRAFLRYMQSIGWLTRVWRDDYKLVIADLEAYLSGLLVKGSIDEQIW